MTTVLVPVTAEWLCAIAGGQVHAVWWERMHPLGQAEYRTVCDLAEAMPLAAFTEVTRFDPISELGGDVGRAEAVCVLPWPPYAAVARPATGALTRCADCWHATGRRRPHDWFRRHRVSARRNPDPGEGE